MKTPYEGTPVPDGEYALVQLSKPGYGRVSKSREYNTDYYDDMPINMPSMTFDQLFDYVKGRGENESIRDFTAVVKNHEIVHVY